MIDTHSHIYLPEFDSDREEVVKRAKAKGVESILLPNVDVETIEAMHQLEATYGNYCYAMMGIHPTAIDENYQEALALARNYIDQRTYIAIGEIGIDLYWDKTFRKEQMEAFEQQIKWAKEKQVPIVIHCRDAFPEVFEVLDAQADEQLTGVFHSFGGGHEEAKRILAYERFMVGINGVVTFKNTNLRDVIKVLPLERLVLETDAPYLAPVPMRGRRNEPAYLDKVAATIASVFDMEVSQVVQQTTANAKQLFHI
ncbi:TatD family hydrolase [Carboxylicivirga taeanensis]|uniref:TatD family hydrolase n=1 Tax=Carboxylicivirga taeanensis TaxID=1416875 RepID=UPI003F6DF33F